MYLFLASGMEARPLGGVKSVCHKLDMATSRMAFLDLNLLVLQFATHRYCYSNPILLKYHAPKAKDSTNRSNVFRDRNIQSKVKTIFHR